MPPNKKLLSPETFQSTPISWNPIPPLTGEAHNDDGDGYFHHDIENLTEETEATPMADKKISQEVPNADASKPTDTHQQKVIQANDDIAAKDVAAESHENDGEEKQRRNTKQMLRNLSSVVQDPEELSIDNKRLQRALEDAGSYSYGIQGISVWFLDDNDNRLDPAPNGFWVNPEMIPPSQELSQLLYPKRKDSVPMYPVAPGVDIAGLLWLESKHHHHPLAAILKSATSSHRLHQSHGSLATPSPTVDRLIWRDLKSLVEDPDTAKGPRLELLHQAGFGQATGIPFKADVTTGFVVFFASKGLDDEILNGQANLVYLKQSAHFIGSAAAMAQARRAIRGQLKLRQQQNLLLNGGDEHNGDDTHDKPIHPDGPLSVKDGGCDADNGKNETKISCLPLKVQVYMSKIIKGGGSQVPPSLSFRQSLWTALGAFCGLLVLSTLNEYYKILSNDEYSLLIGPFGALMTLQYGLTAAPASQPRNAIMGQAVAGAVSLAFTYIPEQFLAVWLRRAVGPAVAIATMVKCGFTHPPAGAHAVLYASGDFNFVFYGLVVLSTVISVIPATLVNNLSTKRQYPTYWGLDGSIQWLKSIAPCTQTKPNPPLEDEDGED